ncbi:MAG: MBL fold metallo-hydrolase [Syntrophales bacterium]
MFNAHLINDPFGDPGVYVEFKFRKETLFFDLGDLHRLVPRIILKAVRIFVSHTHMDHFIGFDQMLRLCLGRDKHLFLFGPPGFIANLESKLGAYTWNLVENYENDFELVATEIHPDRRAMRRYRCQEAFRAGAVCEERVSFDGLVTETPQYRVRAVFLDHKIPCLAFSLEEKMRVNVRKNVLQEMGLPVGAWLVDFKNRILQGDPDDTAVRAWWKDEDRKVIERVFRLGDLWDRAVKITPGQKISYISDVVYSEDNARKIAELAHRSDILFIEACFLDEDRDRAAEKYHLTAKQAGMLARRAEAKRMVVFHFSPKYKGFGHLLVEEATRAFMADHETEAGFEF